MALTEPLPAKQQVQFPKRLITLEEHAIFPSVGYDTPFNRANFKNNPRVLETLQDVGSGRIADMDANHISLQVLSQVPGVGSAMVSGCTGANNELAAAIAKNPDRFSGFAVLPMAYPDDAAKELKRAVTELGLVGAMIDNHLADGTYYDDEKFWTVFETAEELDVPLYIHPAPPSQEELQRQFAGNYPMSIASKLGGPAWGFHADLGSHIIRLYAAGLFERYPKLKIILGHQGEMLPMMVDRISEMNLRDGTTFSEIWDTNIWVTTSGFFHLRHFEMLLKVTKLERVMFSVDYPMCSNAAGRAFVEEVVKSGLLTQEELDLFAYGNAENLLKLKR